MKRAKTLISVLCIVALLVLAVGAAALSINTISAPFGSANSAENNEDLDVSAETASATDTFTSGLPDDSKYFYTDTAIGLAISNGTDTSAKDDKVLVTVANDSGAADGTQANPYAISTATDWESFRTYCANAANDGGAGKYFVLANDIDYANGTIYTLTSFKGTFYGNGHTIKNVNIDTNTATNGSAGLFETAKNAYISDLNIQNYTLNQPGMHSGAVVGDVLGTVTISNCMISGLLTATSYNTSGLTGTFSARNYMGGIVGMSACTAPETLTIYRCASSLDFNIHANFSNQFGYGGIIGLHNTGNGNCIVQDCFSSTKFNIILTNGYIDSLMGGTIGHAYSSTSVLVKNCINITDFVTNIIPNWVGAMVSNNTPGTTLQNNYAYANYATCNASGGAINPYKIGVGAKGSASVTLSDNYVFSDNNATTTNGYAGSSDKLGTGAGYSSAASLWAAAASKLNGKIWILNNVKTLATDMDSVKDVFDHPVFNNKANITFKNVDGSTVKTQEFTSLDIGQSTAAFPVLTTPPSSFSGKCGDFLGWSTSATDPGTDATRYTEYKGDLFGDVTLYAVWELKPLSVAITSDADDPKALTYNGEDVIKMTANVSSGFSNASDLEIKYQWIKVNGALEENVGKGLVNHSLKTVADSGKYKVKITVNYKDNKLLCGEVTSAEYEVNIAKCKPVLADPDNFVLDPDTLPYPGLHCRDLKVSPNSGTTDNLVRATTGSNSELVGGTFDWDTPSKQIDKGENTIGVIFTPDDLDNYEEVVFTVKINSSPLNLTFLLDDVKRGLKLEFEMEWNQNYSRTQIADKFTELFNAAVKQDEDVDHTGVYDPVKLMQPFFESEAFTKMSINDFRYKTGWTWSFKATSALEIKVTFENAEYDVTLDYNDGTTAPLTEKYQYNQFIIEPTIIRDGYEIVAWYVVDSNDHNTTTTWTFDNDRVTNTLKLRAEWEQVVLILESITVDIVRTTPFTAFDKVTASDIKITAHFKRQDDENIKKDKVIPLTDPDMITYGDYKFDKELHVKRNNFKVTYTYNGVTKDAEKTDVNVVPKKIDVSKLPFEEKHVTYQAGVAQSIDAIPAGLLDSNIKSVEYLYRNDETGETLDQSKVIEIGTYSVIAEFKCKTDDYITEPTTRSTTLYIEAESTEIYVEWDTKTFEYSGEVQCPKPSFKYVSDDKSLNLDGLFELTGDIAVKDRGNGYTVTVKLIGSAAKSYTIKKDGTCTFDITTKKLDAPTARLDEMTYTGENINIGNYLSDVFDPAIMQISGDVMKKDVSSVGYTANITITDENYEWKSGKSSESVAWNIKKKNLLIEWSSPEHPYDGKAFNPTVKGLTGLADADLSKVNYANDFIYGGDQKKTDNGSYKITVENFAGGATWAKNYELDENTKSRTYVIYPVGAEVISIEWEVAEYKYNGKLQAPTIKRILDGAGNEITDAKKVAAIKSAIKVGGDAKKSIWAGDYEAVAEVTGGKYYILDGATCEYSITVNDEGEGDEPILLELPKPTLKEDKKEFTGSDIEFELNGFDPNTMTITGTLIKKDVGKYSITVSIKDKSIYAWAGGSTDDITLEFEITAKTVPGGNVGGNGGETDLSKYPIWQLCTMGAGLILSILFACLWASNDKKRKKAEKDTARYKGMAALSAILPVFSKEAVLGMSNMIWSILAFIMVGLTVFMFVMMLISKNRLTKAEAACEEEFAAKEARERELARRKEEENLKRMEEERLRREEADREERRKRDEDMKMMFSGMMTAMMNKPAPAAPASTGVGDVDVIVGKVVQALLPTMQAMLPQGQNEIHYIPYQGTMPEAAFNDDEDIEDDEWDTEDDEQDEVYEAELMDDSLAEEPEAATEVPKRMPSNFRARLKVSSEKNRITYSIIKNEFCAQKGISYRASGRVEKVKFHGDLIAVIGVAKRSIKLWLALDPNEFDKERYFHKDVSDKPRYEKVPMYLRVGSERAQKRVLELLEALFEKFGIERRHKYEEKPIQELIFTLKGNKLLKDKEKKHLLSESVHVHDADMLDNETAENCIEIKDIAPIANENFESISLDVIDENFLDGQRITLDRLKKKGLVSEDCNGIRIIAGSRISKPLAIHANEFTLPAVKMIVLTGGRAVQLVQF